MSTIFVLLFLLFLILAAWGIISPKSLSKFGKKPITRRDAGLGFGLLATFFLILGGVTAPASINNVQDSQELETVQQTDESIRSTLELLTEKKAIPFAKETVEDPSMNKGTSVVSVTGVDGERTISFEVEMKDGKEVSRKQTKDDITKQPVNEVTKVGTKVVQAAPAPRASAPAPSSNCDPNYSGGCVPNVSYDLDCPDIGLRVYVIGNDRHGFDGSDNDGIGCESY